MLSPTVNMPSLMMGGMPVFIKARSMAGIQPPQQITRGKTDLTAAQEQIAKGDRKFQYAADEGAHRRTGQPKQGAPNLPKMNT